MSTWKENTTVVVEPSIPDSGKARPESAPSDWVLTIPAAQETGRLSLGA
jgi:hypothetical protein